MGVDEDFKKLVEYCLKKGIQTYKKTTGPVTLELAFHASALFPESAYKKKKRDGESSDHIPTDNQFSSDDALFWSSAGIPPENS